MKKLRRLSFAAAFTALMIASVTRPAHAASPEADLATAENAYAGLEYASALSGAEGVLAQRGLSHDVLTRATRVAALAHAALGHAEQAKQLFTVLLEYDPDFKIETKLGPRFAEPFAEARGYWLAQGRKPNLDVQVNVSWGQAGTIRTATVDPLALVKKVSIAYRWAPGRDFTTTTIDPGVRTIEVPPNPNGASRLDYYVRAVDAKDNAVFEDGTADSPKFVTVREPVREAGVQAEKKSIFSSPVFYVVGGALLAGAAVGSYFAFRPTEYTPTTAARGTLVANCGNERCN